MITRQRPRESRRRSPKRQPLTLQQKVYRVWRSPWCGRTRYEHGVDAGLAHVAKTFGLSVPMVKSLICDEKQDRRLARERTGRAA